MAWVSVNKRGHETIHECVPEYDAKSDFWTDEREGCAEGESYTYSMDIDLPKGTIERLLGKPLTFERSPEMLILDYYKLSNRSASANAK